MFSIALRAHPVDLMRLGMLVDRFGAEHHLSADDLTRVNLVLDEIVSNAIKHGHPNGGDGEVAVSLALDGGLLAIDITDDGIAFNPLEAPVPNLDLPLDERPIGGLGVHIVKAVSETISYRREDGRNHLSLTMRVGP